jgi:hypothetical protein
MLTSESRRIALVHRYATLLNISPRPRRRETSNIRIRVQHVNAGTGASN